MPQFHAGPDGHGSFQHGTPSFPYHQPPAAPSPLSHETSTVTSNTDGKVAGLEARLAESIAAQDAKVDAITENDKKQNASIFDLNARMAKVESLKSSKVGGPFLPTRSNHDICKEAFLGGFPKLPKNILKAKAERFVGEAPGLVKVEAPGKVGNFVFIKFKTPEQMEAFV